jgi:hypothetical protein
MDGVLAAFGHRPVAAVGLLAALVWCVVVAVDVTTRAPWDRGGWYGMAVTGTDFLWRGVAGVAAAVWLVERAAG